MSLRNRTVKAGIWALVQNGGRQIISTFVFLALARFFLSKDEFGLVALASLFIVFLNVIVALGFGPTIIQRKNLEDIHLNSIFWVNIVVSLVLMCFVLMMSDTIALLLGDIRVSPLISVLSVGMLITALSMIHEALLNRELKFKSLAIRTLVASILSSIVGICIAFLGGGVWALIAMQLTALISGMVVLWWTSSWRPNFHFSYTSLRELLPMSITMTGVTIVTTLNDFIDQFIIGRMLGASSLGIYFVAQRIVKLLIAIFLQSLGGVVLPSLSRLDGDIKRIREALCKAISICTFITFPIFVGLAITADLLIPLLFGNDWEEAIPIMSILSLGAIVTSTGYFFRPALISIGHEKIIFKLTSVAAVVLLIFSFVGAKYGLAEVAIAVVLRGIFMFPFYFREISKHIGFNLGMLFRTLRSNLFSVMFMTIVIYICRFFLNTGPLLEVIILFLVGSASYIVFSWQLSDSNVKNIFLLVKQSMLKV